MKFSSYEPLENDGNILQIVMIDSSIDIGVKKIVYVKH